MSITALPQELIELVFSYLGIKDLFNAWTAVGLELSEHFWKKICEREGLRKGVHDSSWRSVFQDSYTWLTKSFVKRKCQIPNIPMNVLKNLDIDTLFEDYLVLKQGGIDGEVFILNIKNNPVIVSQFTADNIIVGGSDKLLAYHGPDVTLYSFSDNSSRVLLTLASSGLSCNLDWPFCLSDDYFVTLDDTREFIKVFNLPHTEDYSLAIASENIHQVQTLRLVEDFLYIITVTGKALGNSITILKRYHLQRKEWFSDVVLYDTPSRTGLQIRVTSSLFVTWRTKRELKVWIIEEDIMKSMSSEFFISLKAHQERYWFGFHWLGVVDNYIILGKNDHNVAIWCADKPDSGKVILRTEEDCCYSSHAAVSSSLVVIVRFLYFKVLNFHTATYLYEVRFDGRFCNPMANNCYVAYFLDEESSKKKRDLHLYDFSANNNF